MTRIRLISSSTIRAASDHENTISQRIELTPCDLLHLYFFDIRLGLIFQKSTNNSVIEHLKASLSRTLDIFYPLAGRLACDENEDDTGSFFIDCNGEGVLFVHASLDGVTVADFLHPVTAPVDQIHNLFSRDAILNCEGVFKPLLAVQVTELVDGIFIACSANHCVIDGISFWHFFNTWSEISRASNIGEVLSQPLPIFDRHSFHEDFDFPIRLPSSLIQNNIPQSSVVQAPLVQKRVFRFSKEKMAQLKAKANADMGTNKISSLQAIMGYLWVSITRNRCHNPDQDVMCLISIGLRQKILQPPLPKEYFGNAILNQIVKTTAGELLESGSSWAAWQINKAIASFLAGQAHKTLQDWVKSPVLTKIEGLETSNLVIFVSSPRFNIYGNDFGWGRPLGVQSDYYRRTDGHLASYPGIEEGSIDFEVCLLPQTHLAMAKDAEFNNNNNNNNHSNSG